MATPFALRKITDLEGVPRARDNFATAGIHLERLITRLFGAAFKAAFPEINVPKVIMQPGKPHDYQINNAMALSKQLGKPVKEVTDLILSNIPKNDVMVDVVADPKGFIQVFINDGFLLDAVQHIAQKGYVCKAEAPKKVLVDFSSPNIAKDMHVGHLRSTIIGDCLCRIYEHLGNEVLRWNHVGDWGTQFGMLIAYLKREFPNFLTTPPPIADLAAFYKQSKVAFDTDEAFKALAYKEVVALQGGDDNAVKAWNILCNVSRKEFQQIYERLSVRLEEVGESFYRDKIPTVLQHCEEHGLITTTHDGAKVIVPVDKVPVEKADAKGLRRLFLYVFRDFKAETELHAILKESGIVTEDGASIALNKKESKEIAQLDWQIDCEKVYKACEKLIPSGAKIHPPILKMFEARGQIKDGVVALPRFEYPLIVVKRDGGFTYDTTDLAAVWHRTQNVKANHIVAITDVGQAGHFQLIMSAAKDLGYLTESSTMEHVGFGLVTGLDGKRLRTRSGDTVRLVDLMDEAVSRCYDITLAREKEHPQGHTEELMRTNAEIMGIAAIKYYDLRQNHASDYAFSYDKMCELTGNTAIYLLYSYVRVCGVFRKAAGDDVSALEAADFDMTHATSRALALHICRLPAVLDRVLDEAMPSRLTDFAYNLVCRFNEFYAAEQILGNKSNMKLCKVTGEVLKTSLNLLGIDVVERL